MAAAVESTGAGANKPSPSRYLPPFVVALMVMGAAVYSLMPRQRPPAAPTQVYANGLLVNGLAQSGSQFVAVGELGHILVAPATDGPWTEAEISPRRGSTFTEVAVVGDGVLVAVGHDGWVVRSEDNGATWKEVGFGTGEQVDPLLGIAGPYDGKLFAFGGFGLFQVSTDQGKTWQRETHAAFDDRHINGMTRAANGSLLVVGERGLLARSSDNGQTWTALPEIYPGSFFGALSLPSKSLVVYGMRGNVYVSRDFGASWQKSHTPEAVSLFGGAVTEDGRAVIVGASNSILISSDDGASFVRASTENRLGLTAILPLKDKDWLTAGEGGIGMQHPKASEASPAKDHNATQQGGQS